MGAFFNLVFTALLALTALAVVFRQRSALDRFGVTLRNARKAIWESLIVTLLILCGLGILKWYMMGRGEAFGSDEELVSLKYADATYLTYVFVAPLQEFVSRGVFQETVRGIIPGRYGTCHAVIFTSLLFGLGHIHESLSLALLCVLAGLLWGGMFVRHKTLLGVSLSHFFVGNWLGLLGFWDMMIRG